jgi:nitrite reductase/ring-hydroxylating ferredoxin subunit
MNPEFTGTNRPADAVSRNPALTDLAEKIQPLLRTLLEGDDGVRRPLKDLLHGTFIGHPLHPLLTDILIGAWSVAAIFDALELAGSEEYETAADATVIIGAIGAVGAALAGWADWSDTKGEAQRAGLLHGLMNATALTAYIASIAARRAGARKLGIATAFLGYGITGAAAYLGAELSFGMQLGVKHSAIPIDPPTTFVRVLDAASLPDGDTQAVDVSDIPVLVSRRGDAIDAVSAVCTHRGAPLADGERVGDCITCPWHGSRFSLENGRVVEGPATFDLAHFDGRISGGVISVRASSPG